MMIDIDHVSFQYSGATPALNRKICKISICRLKRGSVLFSLANLDVERLV